MKYLLDCYKNFDSFLKWQIVVGLSFNLTWALCIPIMHKLQGLYWSTAVISFYLVLMRASGLILPYFKGISLKQLYYYDMILNFVYSLSIILYFWDVNYFLWAEVVMSIFFSVFGPLLGISWEVYVVKNYKKETFEDYKYVGAFRSSLGGILGSGLVFLLSFFMEIEGMLKFFGVAMIFMLIIQYLNWNKHYKHMEV